MSYPLLWLLLGAALMICGAVWLRRQRDAFIAELKARDDPLARAPRDKTFRRAFQNWLLQRGIATPEGQARGGDLFVLIGVAVLIGLGLYSFWPEAMP
ncbi:MAG: hypothetical protein AAFR17_20040 [Pseudomonadota bacterium]